MMSTRNARRVKDITGMQQICIDLKPDRCDSDVYINQKMDVTKLVEYMDKRKKDGDDITYFHAFVTAIGKVFYNRNKLNRFVSNRHIYEHNDVVVSFVAKVSFDDKSEEMMIMVPIEPNDNIDTISKKISGYVDKVRNSKHVEKEDVLGFAIEKLALSEQDIKNAVMVGDRKFDAIAAKKLGLKAIAVTYGYAIDGEWENVQVDYFAKTPQEIINYEG